MTARGVRQGDKVAIVSTDCAGYIEVLLACMKLGAVYVPLRSMLRAKPVLNASVPELIVPKSFRID